jgi:small subunit ribosomal protein S33
LDYYPPMFNPIKELKKAYPDWEISDESEELRLYKVERKKLRGKGAPKKVKTKEEGKKFKKRKR